MCNPNDNTTHQPETAGGTGTGKARPSAMKQRRNKSDTDLFKFFDGLEIDVDDYTPSSSSSESESDSDSDSDEDESSLGAPTIEDYQTEGGVGVEEDGNKDLSSPVNEENEESSSPKMKKNVSFGNLVELSFPVVDGDPNLLVPNPISLGSEHINETSVSIDEYEETRSPRVDHFEKLRTQSYERRQILKSSKKTLKEHEKAMKQQEKELKKQHKKQQVQRRNSMSNGMIGRDKRRNRVQEFLGRFGTVKNVVASK